MTKIFLVEDDPVIAEAIERHILSWGWDCSRANDFHNVISKFAAAAPQLVLLDITLPFFNGYHWCQEIRKISKVPIIFISSASEELNIVMAMNMGGDDFIKKPFDLNVLTAKIQALLRRAYDFAGQTDLIEHGGVILNKSDTTVQNGDRKTELSKNEYRILQVLMESSGRIIEKEALMQRLWETDSFVDENTLAVNINRLRKKLEGIGITDFVQTKKGMGYLIP